MPKTKIIPGKLICFPGDLKCKKARQDFRRSPSDYSLVSRQMFDPLAAADAQKCGDRLKDLVGLNAEHDHGDGKSPDKSSQQRKGHDDRPGTDQVEPHGELCVSASTQDSIAHGHLVGHADHNKAEDDHDLIRVEECCFTEIIKAQEGGAQHKQDNGEDDSYSQIQGGKRPCIGTDPGHVSPSDRLTHHNAGSGGHSCHNHIQVLIKCHGH